MTFVIALSVVSLLTAVIGCALIWGYDMRRAEEIERGFTKRADEGVALMARAAVRRRRNLYACVSIYSCCIETTSVRLT